MSGREPAREGRPNQEREAEERRLVEAAQRDPARFADLYEQYFELVLSPWYLVPGSYECSMGQPECKAQSSKYKDPHLTTPR